jgi:hypothetical protein
VVSLDTPWWVDVVLFLAALSFIALMIVLIRRTRRRPGPPPLPPARTP